MAPKERLHMLQDNLTSILLKSYGTHVVHAVDSNCSLRFFRKCGKYIWIWMWIWICGKYIWICTTSSHFPSRQVALFSSCNTKVKLNLENAIIVGRKRERIEVQIRNKRSNFLSFDISATECWPTLGDKCHIFKEKDIKGPDSAI